MQTKITKVISLTEEELATVITTAIGGFVVGVLKGEMSTKVLEDLRETTLNEIKEGGFIEELMDFETMKKVFDTLKKER